MNVPITTITYKFRLHTSKEQDKLLKYHSSLCRKVYNIFNGKCRANFKLCKSIPGKYENIKELTKLKQKEEYKYLNDAFSQCLVQSLFRLENNWKIFFQRLKDRKQGKFLKPPQFKKKSKDAISFVYSQLSLTGPNGKVYSLVKIENNKIYLPKLGWFTFNKDRDLLNNDKYQDIPKQVIVKYENGYWYICIVVDRHTFKTLDKTNSTIGIDLGVTHFATTSEGIFYNLDIKFKKYFSKIQNLQRILSKKVKDSNNYLKVKNKLSRIHSHIRNIRYDFLQKLSTTLVKNHDSVVLEKLEVEQMTNKDKKKSSKKLRESILQQGWNIFMDILEYKFKMYRDTSIVYIDPRYTSQTCPRCNSVDKRNRKTQARFKCINCGYEANADVNAANNILNKYLNPCYLED